MHRAIELMILIGVCLQPALAAPPPAPEGYRWALDERFSDEFNGSALDTNRWFDYHPRWRGRPPAKFVPSAVSVTDGLLQIRAGVLPKPDGAFTISGGAVVSRSEEAFYGYYEARMKASKISMSSTFWMSNRPKNEHGGSVSHEIDILETIGAPHPEPKWASEWNRKMNSNTHYFRRAGGKKEDLSAGNKAPLDPPAGEAFHTYGAWWVDANAIRFYLDDQYQFTLHPKTNYSAAPFDRPMHVNMVVETYDWMAPPALDDLTNRDINATSYDWVRAYVLVKEDGGRQNLDRVNPPSGQTGHEGVKATPWPASDPSNTGGWILNREVSDEFEGRELDASKWHVQGTGGEYRSQFIGRAPSQFSTNNVRVEEGKLKLQTRWEPDFPFSEKPDAEGRKYENITTAAVIGKKQFLYGYMEIKCKAADASITSSFWATGHGAELDVFEFLGAPTQAHKKHLEKEYMSTMIDWSKRPSTNVWRSKLQLDWRVADDFHVYGCEWKADYLKFYADGKLVGGVRRQELGDRWVLKNPLWIWVDSETFPWHGLPQQKDLPADFEIEYIRVWQKK